MQRLEVLGALSIASFPTKARGRRATPEVCLFSTLKATQGQIDIVLVNSHTNATRIGWHLWEIGLGFAPGLPPRWLDVTGVKQKSTRWPVAQILRYLHKLTVTLRGVDVCADPAQSPHVDIDLERS